MARPILSDRHRLELEVESAISPHIIAERGYRTITNPEDLPSVFADYQRGPGLLIPIGGTTGEIRTWQHKPDNPRTGKKGKPIKYESPDGSLLCLDVPLRSREMLGHPGVPLWITEGAKKVDSGLSHGIACIIGLQGVYGWRGSNSYGGVTALPDWEDVALNGRDVILAFDSDVMTKASVRGALERLSAFLQMRKASVRYLLLPQPALDEEGA